MAGKFGPLDSLSFPNSTLGQTGALQSTNTTKFPEEYRAVRFVFLFSLSPMAFMYIRDLLRPVSSTIMMFYVDYGTPIPCTTGNVHPRLPAGAPGG